MGQDHADLGDLGARERVLPIDPAVSGTAADNVAVSTVEVRISSGPNYFYSRPFLASSFVFRCERQAM